MSCTSRSALEEDYKNLNWESEILFINFQNRILATLHLRPKKNQSFDGFYIKLFEKWNNEFLIKIRAYWIPSWISREKRKYFQIFKIYLKDDKFIVLTYLFHNEFAIATKRKLQPQAMRKRDDLQYHSFCKFYWNNKQVQFIEFKVFFFFIQLHSNKSSTNDEKTNTLYSPYKLLNMLGE